MTIKIYFRYCEESLSFYNKTLRLAMIVFGIMQIAGWCVSPDKSPVLGIIIILVDVLVIMFIGIRTIKIKRRYEYFEENGRKCNGRIVDVTRKDGGYDEEAHADTTLLYLLVEYVHPISGEAVRFQTKRVNSDPYTYLSSLDVTVYVLPDGRVLATDFKRVRHLKDSVSRQMKQQKKQK